MLYEPNTIHWGWDDIVIHWCDAKEPRMLMRVIGYTRDGLVKTQYVDRRHKRTVWKNDIKNLLDPRDFKLESCNFSQRAIESYQSEFEAVRLWNHVHPEPGVWVKKMSADGQDTPVTRTTSKACMFGTSAHIRLEHGGGWALRFVVAVPDPVFEAVQS
jgi:hypothetical protein